MITLPEKYSYLTGPGMPFIIQEGLKLYGVKEIIGRTHSSIILGWAKTLGIDNIYTNDEMAWCGLSHAVVLLRAGKPAELRGYDILRALKYAEYGIEIAAPGLGDTLVFIRPGGGHVGIYVAESKDTYHVMGGNSSNTYKIVEIEKRRLVAARTPLYKNRPLTAIPMYVSSTGIISKNES
jgi:uncharacterized protein (TIGR02594 family)